jgi:hypothetical protein
MSKSHPKSSSPIILAALLLIPIHAQTSEPMLAYIDPGTGSLILQVLLGALLASLLFIKAIWRKIKSLVGRLLGRKPTAEADTSAPLEPTQDGGGRDA